MVNRSDNYTNKMTGAGVFGTILFFASFLPIIFAIYKSYTGVFFGLQGFAWFFGLPAIIITLIYEFMLFFLPLICLIYQIIFFRNYIRRHKKLKTATLILVGLILSSALISILFPEPLLSIKIKLNEPKIRSHMTAVYGEKAASEITYVIESRYEMKYKAYSPVLPQDKSFEVRVINEGTIHEELINTFTETNKDYVTKLTDYIVSKEKLPNVFTYEIGILSIDFQDYKNGDDFAVLFDRTKYVIRRVNAFPSEINKTVIMDTIDKVWKDIYPNVPLLNGDLSIYLNRNDQMVISANIREDKKQEKFIARISDWTKPDFQSTGEYPELDNKEIELKR